MTFFTCNIHLPFFFFTVFAASGYTNGWTSLLSIARVFTVSTDGQPSAPVGSLWSASVNQPFLSLLQRQYWGVSIYLVVVIRMKNQNQRLILRNMFRKCKGLIFLSRFLLRKGFIASLGKLRNTSERCLRHCLKPGLTSVVQKEVWC